MKTRRPVMMVVALAIVGAACSGASPSEPNGQPTAEEASATTSNDAEAGTAAVLERLTSIDEAIAAWRTSETLEEANAAAETAANLVLGPNGPGSGDRDGDGVIGGASAVGLLPGVDGTPIGLASALDANACVNADVLGGSWSDPGARWDEMLTAIDQWRSDNNTMPSLASHPMRIVGWSTFTQDFGSLDLAHEYAGHAKLHVDISLEALDC